MILLKEEEVKMTQNCSRKIKRKFFIYKKVIVCSFLDFMSEFFCFSFLSAELFEITDSLLELFLIEEIALIFYE